MNFTTRHLLALTELDGIGRIKALAIYKFIKNINFHITDDMAFVNIFKLYFEQKIKPSIKPFNEYEIKEAFVKAEEIIQNSQKNGIKIISFLDDDFPEQLKGIMLNNKDVSPIILHYKGDISITKMPGIAIIGTREASPEGITAGEYYGEQLSKKGFNIISGLAIGCDTSGHRGALKGNGKTTAFLAHGLDTIYPKENKSLASQILENGGLLISEYPIGTPIMGNRLVERDRLQAGLADATIVIQTGVNGGTMHAVKSTLENNKNLYVVDFKDNHVKQLPKVQGNLLLLSQNAIPLRNIEPLLNDLKSKEIKNKHSTENKTLDLFDFNSNEVNSIKKFKGIIFDLDQTLIDSSISENSRNKRDWQSVYKMIPSFVLYPGLNEIFSYIRANNIKVCIVTTAPTPYCKKVIEYFNIPSEFLVDYHTVQPIKPAPNQMLKALELLQMNAEDVISFGDRSIDFISSETAGIKFVGCLWGSNEKDLLLQSKAFKFIYNPIEILQLI